MTVKERVLASATKVFAEHGFRDAKVADIVKGAEANIASVNYYYGSKESLFAQVLRQTFAAAQEVYPVHGNLAETAPARERLAAFARSVLLRSFESGPAGDFNRIMSKTVHTPGSPIAMICAEVEVLKIQPLQKVLLDFLGSDISESTLTVATLNFMSLATVISKHAFLLDRIFVDGQTDAAIEAFIDQQVAVILVTTSALKTSV